MVGPNPSGEPMNIKNASPIEQAALAWWKGSRPLALSEQEHLDNPTINLSSDGDEALAEAVAEALRTRGEGELEPARAVTRQEAVKVMKETRKANVKA